MATATRTLWIGNKWQVGVKYANADGTPFTFSSNRKPKGNLYLGGAKTDPIPLTVENGGLIVMDQTAAATMGAVVFQVLPETIDPTIFKGTTYNRIEAQLLDTNGESTTQQIVLLDVRNPQTDDLVGASFSAIVITVQGSLNLEGGGSVPGSGGTILRYPVAAVSSYNALHTFDYQPSVWAVDSDNEPVEVDYAYLASTVHFTFTQPFTGTLYLA